jgi:hypothetical protein
LRVTFVAIARLPKVILRSNMVLPSKLSSSVDG